MHEPQSCTSCGFHAVEDAPRSAGRFFVKVLDSTGSRVFCDACLVQLLIAVGWSGDVTVFVARPVAVTR